jgi:hypothetical protein
MTLTAWAAGRAAAAVVRIWTAEAITAKAASCRAIVVGRARLRLCRRLIDPGGRRTSEHGSTK